MTCSALGLATGEPELAEQHLLQTLELCRALFAEQARASEGEDDAKWKADFDSETAALEALLERARGG